MLEKSKHNFICKDLKLELIAVPGYEEVWRVSAPSVGLLSIIAIHNTKLGFALGGIRIYPYATFEEALTDALRLAQGMTYKSAIAEVGTGGGKSVIIADAKSQKTPELLRAFGEAVNFLGGKYVCAEDVGCTVDDVSIIRETTRFVVGLMHKKSSGNPSPFTAWGIYRGVQAVLKKTFGSESVEGRRIAVQGLGSVGFELARLLFWGGAEIIAADIDSNKTEIAARAFNAKIAEGKNIFLAECDVFAPCAMGGILNAKTIPVLQCRAIAGAANNQLLTKGDADLLRERKILYAPDFVINAGGLLNVASELDEAGYSPQACRRSTHRIYNSLLSIFEIAEKNRISTHNAACALADYKIQYSIGRRQLPAVFHH